MCPRYSISVNERAKYSFPMMNRLLTRAISLQTPSSSGGNMYHAARGEDHVKRICREREGSSVPYGQIGLNTSLTRCLQHRILRNVDSGQIIESMVMQKGQLSAIATPHLENRWLGSNRIEKGGEYLGFGHPEFLEMRSILLRDREMTTTPPL